MRRISALTRCLCGVGFAGLWFAAVAAQSVSTWPAFPEDPKSHVWEKVGEGIYAFISPIGITPLVSGNSLVVVGDESVLVVDTGQFPSLARAEIANIRRLTPLPVRYVVNTHWHPDHWTGNGEFKHAYPAVTIISTQNTRTLAQTRGTQYVAPEYPGKILEYIDQTLARGTHSDGKPLLTGELPYIEMAKVQFRSFGADLASAVLTYSDMVFADSLDVYLGKRLVQIKFLGRGNTGGDAVVYVPDAKVVATGDLVVNPFPYGTGSFYGEWLATLQKLAALDSQAIVPGHGVVEHDKTYLLRLIKLLEDLRADVAASVKAGLSLEETQRKITLSDAKVEFCGALEFREMCENSFENNFVVPAVKRTYQELKEGPLASED
jgi:cyclase